MNMVLDDDFWHSLLRRIDERQVIPIVGPALSIVEIDGQQRRVDKWLAEALMTRLFPDEPSPSDELSVEQVAVMFDRRGGNRYKVSSVISSLLRIDTFPVPAPLLALADVQSFQLFGTVTWDGLFVRALANARREALTLTGFLDDESFDLPTLFRELRQPVVVEFFGNRYGSDLAITEEDREEVTRKWNHALPDRPKLALPLKACQLLFLGVGWSVPFLRSWVGAIAGRRLSEGRTDVLVVEQVDAGFTDEWAVEFATARKVGFIRTSPVEFVQELRSRWRQHHPFSLQTEAREATVYLSCAGEDREAAGRIAEVLQGAGVRVWWNRELHFGDSFAERNRNEVESCDLFLPLISRATDARTEAYFRMEWHLAISRQQRMAADNSFIFPILLDDLPLNEARVPEEFRYIQPAHASEGRLTNEAVLQILGLLDQICKWSLREVAGTELTSSPEQVARARIAQAIAQRAVKLDLSALGLVRLPETLRNVTDLRELLLGRNKLAELPPVLSELAKLTELDLSENHLRMLPREIGRIRTLKSLNLTSNNLVDLPDAISELIGLERLQLSGNALLNLPSAIGALPLLRVLEVDGNQLPDLPPEISQLRQLQVLEAGRNQLRCVPQEMGELRALHTLNLSGNQLTGLPTALGRLSVLDSLNLAGNQLTKLPDSLSGLVNLASLDVSTNALRQLPPIVLRLQSLRALDVSRNPIGLLPIEIDRLIGLKELRAEECELTSLPPKIGRLTHLEVLWLRKNELHVLPESMRDLAQLRILLLHGNPTLSLPSEVLGEEPAAGVRDFTPQRAISAANILSYYLSVRDPAETVPLNEGRLILVGHGDVGKTSLLKRLLGQGFDPAEPTTHGIRIEKWDVEVGQDIVKIQCWDFGGQQVMHGLHQLFFSPRNLYLVVLSGRSQQQDESADYWLRRIARKGAPAAAIVVLNKSAECPFELDRGTLRRRHQYVREFVITDAREELGIDRLREEIAKALASMTELRTPFRWEWMALKEQVARLEENYLTEERYRELCAAHGVTDESGQDQLAQHFHALGVALSFADDLRLRDTLVLNASWLVDGIYRVITAPLLHERKGVLEPRQLRSLLDPLRYPPSKHDFLLRLMEDFQLCVPMDEKGREYVFPDQLPKEEPATAQAFTLAKCLAFEWRYAWGPEELFPRFISLTHSLGLHEDRSRYATVLGFEEFRILIRLDAGGRRIEVLVDGPVQLAGRRRALAVVQGYFTQLHAETPDLEARPFVPVPGCVGVAIPYEDLLVFEQNQIGDYPLAYQGRVVTVNVQRLLEGVEIRRSAPPSASTSPRVPKVFVSYAREDSYWKDHLVARLGLLQQIGLMTLWHDEEIPLGADWNADLKREVQAADLFVLLVSKYSLASEYIRNVELKQALEQQQEGLRD